MVELRTGSSTDSEVEECAPVGRIQNKLHSAVLRVADVRERGGEREPEEARLDGGGERHGQAGARVDEVGNADEQAVHQRVHVHRRHHPARHARGRGDEPAHAPGHASGWYQPEQTTVLRVTD